MDTPSVRLGSVDRGHLLQSVFGSLGVIAGGFLLYNLAALGVFLALGAESLEAVQGQPLQFAILSAVASTGFLVASLGYLAVGDAWELVHVRRVTLRDALYVAGGFVALVVGSIVVAVLVQLALQVGESLFGITSEFGQNTIVTTGREQPELFLYMIPVALFVVGPGEELLFRGVVQGLFRRALGVWPGILLASALFGLGHYFAISSGNPWTYLFITATLGVILGYVYERTENIVVPAAIHGVFNSFLFVMNWLLLTVDPAAPAVV